MHLDSSKKHTAFRTFKLKLAGWRLSVFKANILVKKFTGNDIDDMT